MKRIFFTLTVALVAASSAFAAKIDTLKVETKNLETPMDIYVVTPDGMKAGDKLPVVYALHGYSGNYTNWLKFEPRILDMADRYNFIVVTPDGRDTWYMDSPANPKIKMESFFINDLIPYIDAKYPTDPQPAKRAITGLSMGGHGALYLAFRNPDVFGNAASMSGGVDIRPFPENWNLPNILGPKDQYPERWEEATVINVAKNLKPGQINIYFDCGVDDFFAEVNENLHRELLSLGIPHDYASRPGAHTWAYWQNSLMHHFLFFNEAFRR